MTDIADTDPRKPLTDITWATLNYQLTPETFRADGGSIGWPEMVDLAYELAPYHPRVPIEGWRILVDFLRSRHPITLEWATLSRRSEGGRLHYDVTRATGIALYLNVPRPGWTHFTGDVRFSYPGFGHGVRLNEIRSISFPETTYTYDVPEESAPA